jgi:predicted DCC family thiol-disulfide oxidoreductase YuxK
MGSSAQMSEITVIYDGQCELCKNSVHWVERRLPITALDFHTAELATFGLTKQQCSREVFVITDHTRVSGAVAVAFLLSRRGNKFLASLITLSGPLARITYRWIAGHRNTWPVKALSSLLAR